MVCGSLVEEMWLRTTSVDVAEKFSMTSVDVCPLCSKTEKMTAISVDLWEQLRNPQ